MSTNAVLLIFRQGAANQILIDGKDIAPFVTRVEVVKAGRAVPEVRLTLDPVMVTTITQEAQLRIDGIEDCPEHLAREAYRLLRERFDPEAAIDRQRVTP